MTLRLVTWNLFHGRDHPPDPALLTWRSRLLRIGERGERYAQVNRSLYREFATVLDRLPWDVALLQEARPRWHRRLRRDLGADGACALTDRNSLAPLRALLTALNPDLIASNEGGSNQLLVRAPLVVEDVRRHTLTEAPERRRMLWARVGTPAGPLAVANLHGSTGGGPEAVEQVLAAAARAVDWAGDLPLVFGGDLNLSPAHRPWAFEQLAERFGLAQPAPDTAIDHLLMRGLEVVEPPRRLPDAVREVPAGDERVLQLSDHACVSAVAGMR